MPCRDRDRGFRVALKLCHSAWEQPEEPSQVHPWSEALPIAQSAKQQTQIDLTLGT